MKSKSVSRLFLGAAFAAILAVTGISGCGNSTEQVLQGGRCGDACARYAACYNPAYDVNACTNRCQNATDQDVISGQVSEDCLTCIGASACASATYNCQSLCSVFITVQ